MSFNVLILAALVVSLGCQAPSSAASPSSPPPQGLAVEVTTQDLAVGENRIALVVLKDGTPVSEAEVHLAFYFLAAYPPELRTTAVAVRRLDFHEDRIPGDHTDAASFVAKASLDQPGRWGLEARIKLEDGTAGEAGVGLEVRPQPMAPAVGSPAIASESKTLRNAPLAQLTSTLPADPELYNLSIAEALNRGQPALITFASPAFCSSRTCGPQLHVVQHLKQMYRGQMSFIHVEIYDNPQEMALNPVTGRLSPIVRAWRLPTEPWTFLIDAKGIIAVRFEGFVTLEELEPAVQSLLTRSLGL